MYLRANFRSRQYNSLDFRRVGQGVVLNATYMVAELESRGLWRSEKAFSMFPSQSMYFSILCIHVDSVLSVYLRFDLPADAVVRVCILACKRVFIRALVLSL